MSSHPSWDAQARVRRLSELTTYFASGEADQGLRSSWQPLVDIARGGFVTSPDPERGIERRFRTKLETARDGETAVARARVVRSALLGLSDLHQCALYAAHGPVAWNQMIDAAFGRGMAIKVEKRLGDLAPVALLTQRVAVGFALTETEPDGTVTRRAAWNTPGGWLVAMCLDKSDGAKQRQKAVRAEAEILRSEAEAVYLYARGCPVMAKDEARAARAPKRARRPSFNPFEPMAEASL